MLRYIDLEHVPRMNVVDGALYGFEIFPTGKIARQAGGALQVAAAMWPGRRTGLLKRSWNLGDGLVESSEDAGEALLRASFPGRFVALREALRDNPGSVRSWSKASTQSKTPRRSSGIDVTFRGVSGRRSRKRPSP